MTQYIVIIIGVLCLISTIYSAYKWIKVFGSIPKNKISKDEYYYRPKYISAANSKIPSEQLKKLNGLINLIYTFMIIAVVCVFIFKIINLN